MVELNFSISNILAMFFFSYWLVYKEIPFPIIYMVALYTISAIVYGLLTTIIKFSSDKIEKESIKIDKKIKEFNERLIKLEKLTEWQKQHQYHAQKKKCKN